MSRIIASFFLLSVFIFFLIPTTSGAQGGWDLEGPEFRANTTTVGSQGWAEVAIGSVGKQIIVWEYDHRIFAQLFLDDGTSYGSEKLVATWGHQPAVAANSTNHIVIVWQYITSSPNEIHGRRYDHYGSPRGGEFTVNGPTDGYVWDAKVSMDGSGNFVVVWDNKTEEDIYARCFNEDGNPLGPEFKVNTSTTGDQEHPDVSHDADGNFVIVWVDGYSTVHAVKPIRGQQFDASGNRVGGEFVASVARNSKYEPAISHDPSGGFVVVWESLGQDTTYPPECECPDFGVFGRRFDSNGDPLGDEFMVNTTVAGDQQEPDVAVNLNGSFCVVWQSGPQYSILTDIFGQRFDSDGNRQGSEFQINTTTSGRQVFPEIASDLEGKKQIVIWEGDGPGDDYGVFAQRYKQTLVATLFKDFQGLLKNDAVELVWAVSTDQLLSGFDILRRCSTESRPRSILNGILLTPDTRQFVDKPPSKGTRFEYTIIAMMEDGTEFMSQSVEIVIASVVLELGQNFPNPFKQATMISFSLPEPTEITLEIYDVLGRFITRLAGGVFVEGPHQVVWDGVDAAGNPVGAGIYVSRLKADKNTLSSKMMKLK